MAKTLYVVVNMIGGYAREDAPVPVVVGSYENQRIANIVKLVAGSGATVHPVIVNEIPRGIKQSLEQMGISINNTEKAS